MGSIINETWFSELPRQEFGLVIEVRAKELRYLDADAGGAKYAGSVVQLAAKKGEPQKCEGYAEAMLFRPEEGEQCTTGEH